MKTIMYGNFLLLLLSNCGKTHIARVTILKCQFISIKNIHSIVQLSFTLQLFHHTIKQFLSNPPNFPGPGKSSIYFLSL
jgi:hypothetical protein